MTIALCLDLTTATDFEPVTPVESPVYLVPEPVARPQESYLLRDEHGEIVPSKPFDDLVAANQYARKLLRKIGVYRKSDNVAMSFQGPMGWNGPGRKASTLGTNYAIRPKKKATI